MFTEQQRNDLKKLGLFDEQIEAINNVLPLCKSSLNETPAKDAVRKKIRELEKSIDEVQTAISQFLGDSSAAGEEAIKRVTLANIEFNRGLDSALNSNVLETHLHRTFPVLSILRSALQTLSREDQRRFRPSSPFAIQLLEEALRHGWVKHQPSGRLVNPYFNWEVSRTKRPFPEIARIFYEAIGQEDKDIERPIKAYLSFTKNQTARRRQGQGIISGSVDEKKLPPKSGRQPNKKKNLPS
jgi:hypothetical protein